MNSKTNEMRSCP